MLPSAASIFLMGKFSLVSVGTILLYNDTKAEFNLSYCSGRMNVHFFVLFSERSWHPRCTQIQKLCLSVGSVLPRTEKLAGT